MTRKTDIPTPEPDDTSVYLRGPKPLRAGRGLALSREARSRILACASCLAAGLGAWYLLFGYALQSAPFRLDAKRQGLLVRGATVIERGRRLPACSSRMPGAAWRTSTQRRGSRRCRRSHGCGTLA